MEYNNYYPVQSGHPPPNQQHGGGGPQIQQPPPGGQMMHNSMPQQNIRQAMQPGPSSHHQQMQQMQSQQHIGHHSRQINPQQQHPNYQQVQQPHPHGPPVSHSNSPHAQQQQQQQHQQQQQQQQQQHQQQHHHQQHNHNHNHQPNIPVSLPQQQAMSQNVHPQSPHHHGGPIQMQQPQPLGQVVRPQVGQPGMQHPVHHQQNFFGGSPMSQSNLHHYPQNPHHPNHQPQHHHHHQPSIMHHAPPLSAHHPSMHQGLGRSSPYFPNILQTEFRIIELNRRLQCRPTPRHPYNPLPNPYDESIWWERFASDFFEDDATLTLRVHDDKPVEYTIGRTLIPRFFRSYFDGGVTDLSVNLRNPKETYIHPHMITLDCDQAFIVTNNIVRHPSIATNQSVVVHTEGHLVLDFVSNNFDNLSIKSWRFYTRDNREYIERSLLTTGLPNNIFAEPITRHGFTKSTITYLKMCMIMEPMQELMFQNRQTKLDPRGCLRKLLHDRYNFRSGEDNRTTTNKRRKRKPSAAPSVVSNTGANKKSKAGINNAMVSSASMNNMMMSPSNVAPGFPLASQDVMVVGEPSMMGGDFGDDNERLITRLENTQYEPTSSTPSHPDESDGANASASNDITIASDELESINDNHAISSPLLQMRQQQAPPTPQQPHQQVSHQLQHQQPQSQSEPHQQQQQQQHHLTNTQQTTSEQPSTSQVSSPQDQVDQTSPQTTGEIKRASQQENQKVPMEPIPTMSQAGIEINESNQRITIFEHHEDINHLQEQEADRQTDIEPLAPQNGEITHAQQIDGPIIKEEISLNHDERSEEEEDKQRDVEDSKMNFISDSNIDADSLNNIGSAEMTENHTNLVQNMSEEPNSNSQLPCSTPTSKSAIEQQQPVDNGVA